MAGPHTYEFDLSIFEMVQEDDYPRAGHLRMNGPVVLAYEIVVEPTIVRFMVAGQLYGYAADIRPDYAAIQVTAAESGEVMSTILPRNQQELLDAVETILTDHEPVLDAAQAANA